MSKPKKVYFEQFCEECNEVFVPKTKRHRICSDECRKLYISKKQAAKYNRFGFAEIKCIVCQKPFTPASKMHKMCSPECRRKNYYDKYQEARKRSERDGTGPHWLRTRFVVLNRDGFRCQYCGRGPGDGTTLQVDHIYPESKGGDYSLENLTTACSECNKGKSDILLNKRLSG